jgi:uncharacterized membrane protein
LAIKSSQLKMQKSGCLKKIDRMATKKTNIFKISKKIYYKAIHSIAFLPTMFSIGFAGLAFLLIRLHEEDLGTTFVEFVPWLYMKDADHAADVITALLTGIITLTTFSFSVVMIILNQAAQNLIPKVLYKLREDKFMQVVLGFYVGTIIYYIILLVNFGKEDDELYVPDLAFLIGNILAIACIFLFVFFIHRTTVSIHAEKIAQRLYKDTIKKLAKEKKSYGEKIEVKWTEDENVWLKYPSGKRGFIQSVEDELAEDLRRRDLKIKIIPALGKYLVEKMPLIAVNKSVPDSVVREIEAGLIMYNEERVGESSKFGFVQIKEIAVKALSTGLNDPGTALTCIDFLADLFCTRIKQNGLFYKKDKFNEVRVVGMDEPFENLFFTNFSPIRNYGKKDSLILEKLTESIAKISLHDEENKYCKLLNDELEAIINTAKENITTKADLEHFFSTLHYNCGNTLYFEEVIRKSRL